MRHFTEYLLKIRIVGSYEGSDTRNSISFPNYQMLIIYNNQTVLACCEETMQSGTIAQSMDWFDLWSKRNSEPEPRIHEELNDNSRKRIAHALKDISDEDITRSYDLLVKLTGYDPRFFQYSHSRQEEQYEFITKESSQDMVLDYLEILLTNLFEKKTKGGRHRAVRYVYDSQELIGACILIEQALVENGILIQMTPSPSEEMKDSDWNRSDLEQVRFQQLSDETIIESDQELRILALGERWEKPLEPYNEAWNLYRDGTFTYVILEKLYNSLEAVCTKICIDLEGWLDDSDGLGDCISELRERGLFQPNDEMVAEWQEISHGMQIGVQRAGSDRKRHENVEQDYLILMLHQISSFLTFVIKGYEKGKHE